MLSLSHQPWRPLGALAAAGLLAMAPTLAAATAARVSVNASNVGGSIYGGGFGFRQAQLERHGPHGNHGKAQADIANGLLHVYAKTPEQSLACWLHVPLTCVPSYATASAELWDVVTLHASDLGGTRLVPWNFTVTGIEDDGPWRGVGGGAEAKLAFYFSSVPSPGVVLYQEVKPGDVIAGTFELPSGPDSALTLYFHAGMVASAWNGGLADYSHTGRFSWQLPAGVTVSSGSGVFMANRTPPVPEPATAWLAALGLLPLAVRLRSAARRGHGAGPVTFSGGGRLSRDGGRPAPPHPPSAGAAAHDRHLA